MPVDHQISVFLGSPPASAFSEATRNALRTQGRLLQPGTGDILLVDRVFFVASGFAKLRYHLGSEQEHIVAFLSSGSLVLDSLSGARSLDLIPLSSCALITFPPDAFLDAISIDPAATRAVIRFVTEQVRAVQEHAAAHSRLSACQRLAFFLETLASEENPSPSLPRKLRLAMSRGEIADHLGLTIETISRCMTHLKTQGIISCPSREEVVILDRRALIDCYAS